MAGSEWLVDSEVTGEVERISSATLAAYELNPSFVKEHVGIERDIAEGGYGRRQIYELVQNGADAALEDATRGARLAVVYTGDALYCANQGEPITVQGVETILGSHNSYKRSSQIGRFGVGFKSVLAVCSAPEFFSRSGSFRFDPGRADEEIRARAGDFERTPSLRLAYPADAEAERLTDPVLAELMSWADTVIRMPLRGSGDERAEWLPADIRDFPAQFMLFSEHVGVLEFDDRVSPLRRRIESKRVGENEIVLVVDGEEERWRLVSTMFKPSEADRTGAGELADRKELPLTWAVPLHSAGQRGSFWAFFPTEFATTLRGILNAPWKTNADRQNLLKSTFNDKLIDRAASLVAKSLADLATVEDPGRHLDYLPGRGREAPQWADKLLGEVVYSHCAYAKTLPDLDGIMRFPDRVKVHPTGLSQDALERFAEVSTDRSWTHPLTESRERRPRVEMIVQQIEDGPGRVDTVREWFASVCEDELTVERSGKLARLASSLVEDEKGLNTINSLAFVLTASGKAVVPDPVSVFFGEGLVAPEGVEFVHPDLESDPAVRGALEAIGLRPLDAIGQMEALLVSADRLRPEDWREFWRLSRLVPIEQVVDLVSRRKAIDKVRVYRRDQVWSRLRIVLLPGDVVPVESEDDNGAVIDIAEHAADIELLRALGVVGSPEPGRVPEDELWFGEYRREMVQKFLAREDLRARPQEAYLVFDPNGFVGPLGPLDALSDASTARFCDAVYRQPDARRCWELRHKTKASYGLIECPNPAMWRLRQVGTVPSSLGRVRVPHAVGPSLAQWQTVLPVADIDQEAADALGLAAELEMLTRETWLAAVARCNADDAVSLGMLFTCAIEAGIAPATELKLDGRSMAPSDMVACGPDDDPDAIRELGVVPVVVEAGRVDALVERWQMQSAAGFFTFSVRAVGQEDPIPLRDLFPDLAAVVPECADLVIVPCAEVLRVRAAAGGAVTTAAQVARQGEEVFVAADVAETEAILDAIDAEFSLGLDEGERAKVLEGRARHRANDLRHKVAATPELAEKLLAAIGADALARRVPAELVERLPANGSRASRELAVARAALAVHGVDVLREYQADFRAAHLIPPNTWAGSRAARDFVADLGFPVAYAGFPGGRLDAVVTVAGPPNLPSLHPYQQAAAANIKALLRKGSGRGLLSLPTGAGKTRTAVQAVVESMVAGDVVGPVLWVAQTEELCEQAVTAWEENWRAHGADTPLRLGRLWAQNEVTEADVEHQVVVATIQKLGVVMKRAGAEEEYGWLSRAGAVVIDEAHRAVGPEYTMLLRWQGMGGNKNRVPIIGLSATPYRVNETEAERLVKRFGSQRLDEFDGDPYQMLQEMQVLARVKHLLLSGSNVELSRSEMEQLQRTKLLPAAVRERIGNDADRNREIVDSILKLPDDTTVLLFAASVQHAELMAGLLTLAGVPSQAVSSGTPTGARRHYIEQFRNGAIRVLTNYGIFTEGFDAPGVKAVYVVRPTYSPILYQQMIGRGLRGPLNGGKEECLIVNVEDTIAEFGEQLAFAEFEQLWNDDK